jgi:hypothetical protein
MAHHDVVEALPLRHLEFPVRFADGLTGRVRLQATHLYGVFEPLKEPSFFNRLYVKEGFVTWPGEIALAPDAMYEAIRQQGEWVLE